MGGYVVKKEELEKLKEWISELNDDDKLLTLSTCAFGSVRRTVVHAKLIK